MDDIAGVLQTCAPCLGTQLQRALSAMQHTGEMPGGCLQWSQTLVNVMLMQTNRLQLAQRMRPTHH